MDEHSLVNGKKLRCGFTTGSSAAAASKGAVLMLFSQKTVEEVEIYLPKGFNHEFLLHNQQFDVKSASCSVIKDGGDDPDITTGIDIFAKATILPDTDKVIVTGGIGVGIVTKKGLSVAPGKPAINPVPHQMIIDEVTKVKPSSTGVKIEIYVPGGEEVAKKTFNSRLGIVGGISIIGTTGVVKPMSEEAFKDAIMLELNVQKSSGVNRIILTPGNYGETFCKKILNIKENIVNISNFFGASLEMCVHLGFDEILVVGHIGKLIKVAGGNFNTHSRVSDGRMEILIANFIDFTDDIDLLRKIAKSNTTEEAIEYIDNKDFFNHIAEKIRLKSMEYIKYIKKNDVNIEVITFSEVKGLLGQSVNAFKRLNG